MSQPLPLYESTPAFIRYTDSKKVTTNRVVIPASAPQETLTVIDVTEVTAEERERLAILHVEYKKYVADCFKTMLNFEGFIKHVYDETLDLKWRTLTKSNIVA